MMKQPENSDWHRQRQDRMQRYFHRVGFFLGFFWGFFGGFFWDFFGIFLGGFFGLFFPKKKPKPAIILVGFDNYCVSGLMVSSYGALKVTLARPADE